MRTIEKNHITLHYPDEIAFAFNPLRIYIDEQDQYASMNVFLGDKETLESINDHSIDFFGGYCVDDVQSFVQSYFAKRNIGELTIAPSNDNAVIKKSETGRLIGFSIYVYGFQGEVAASFSFTTFVIWGVTIKGGKDVFNGYRKLTWFSNFPFTFGLYVDTSAQLLYAKNGRLGGINDMSAIDGQGLYNIAPAAKIADGDTLRVYDYSGEIKQATFDNSFDLTFYMGGGAMSTLFDINIDNTHTEGTYLRWIDRHGFWCYWLFKDGDSKRKVTANNQFYHNELIDYDDVYGYHGVNGLHANYSRSDSYQASAPLVDKDTFDFLQGVATSPIVDMYCGKDEQGNDKWMGVYVDAATYTKKYDKNLEDFVINISLPTFNAQRL